MEICTFFKAIKADRYGAKLIVAGEKAAVASRCPPVKCKWGGKEDGEARSDAAMLALASTPDETVLAHQFAKVLVDGSFPDWRRIVPAGDHAPTMASFNATYIAAFGEALGGAGKYDGRTVTILATKGIDGNADYLNPHVVFGQLADAFGILMPLRAERKATMPTWLAQPYFTPAEKEAKAA